MNLVCSFLYVKRFFSCSFSASKNRYGSQSRFNDRQYHKKTSKFFLHNSKFIWQFTSWCWTYCSQFVPYGVKTWRAGSKLGARFGRRTCGTANKSDSISDFKLRGGPFRAKEKEICKRSMAGKETSSFITGVIVVHFLFLKFIWGELIGKGHVSTLFHSHRLKLYGVSAGLSVIRLTCRCVYPKYSEAGERSGSVDECLTRDRRAAGWASPASLRCGPWARHIYPSLVLFQPRETVPHNWKIVEWT